MVRKIFMAKLSPTLENGTLAKWSKKVGDKIEEGESIAAVETDKATMEYQATAEMAGHLHAIVLEEGQIAPVGAVIAIVKEEGDTEEALADAVAKAKAALKPATPAKDQLSDLPTAPKEEPKNPTGPGLSQPRFVPAPALTEFDFSVFTAPLGDRILASPLARKIAKEKGIDLSRIKGSGPGGRIVEADLTAKNPDLTALFGPKRVPHTLPGSYHEEPMSSMRKVIGKRLQESKTFIPHFYVAQEVDMGPVSALREQLAAHGLKISFNDFVVKAVALALKEVPALNSGYNSETASIIRFETIDISVAVSIPDGLITPIVRLADQKNIGHISNEVRELATKARKHTLKPEEFTGGSFTISNLGMYGVTEFVGIINPPQAGILSVGGIEEKPVVKNGQIAIGKVMKIFLSADHRVVDGSDGALFIKSVQKYLETPAILLV